MPVNNTTLPKGITLETLQSYWDTAYREYTRAFRRTILLDAADRGRMWENLRAKFPDYQILPDTNLISYIKSNLVASIYSVSKSAALLPTSDKDKDVIENLNRAIDHQWGVGEVAKYQRQAGERAALCNLGLTQVGWDAGENKLVFKNISPIQFMRDPNSANLSTAPYAMTWEVLHINVLKGMPLYSGMITDDDARIGSTTATVEFNQDRSTAAQTQGQLGYLKLIIYWVRIAGEVHEIHVLDNKKVLYVKENLRPKNEIPVVALYCNDPSGDLIGTSEPSKIFANTVAYNLLSSVMLTSEYKNQRPPRFISATAGLNIDAFIKHGNEADRTFIVNGDATRAVYYHKFPEPSAAASILLQRLQSDIQQVSGVDGRYTGRDTGSVLTTGGVESMLNQVTMIDAPKIANYEDYTRKLTKLVIGNLIEFAPKRSFFVKVPNTNEYRSFEVDFPKIDANTVFEYEINISSELPKNKARVAQSATTVLEKQLQYAQAGGSQVTFIEPEEWLMFQDFPFKEMMMERMKIQRAANWDSRVAEILTTFAETVKQGVNPQEAMSYTAEMMRQREQPQVYGQSEFPQVVPEQEPATPDMVGSY